MRTARRFTSTNSSNRPMQALLVRRGYSKAGVIEHLEPGDPERMFVNSSRCVLLTIVRLYLDTQALVLRPNSDLRWGWVSCDVMARNAFVGVFR